ncbi:hypothetical protein [Nostoc sp.]|uniref:hypothetical protein n=1 Tax=Nostoc sp. TaxID=1180 RepID=UPI002FF5C4DC
MKSIQTPLLFMLLTETEEVSLSGGEVGVGDGQGSPGQVSRNTTSTNGVDGSTPYFNTEDWLGFDVIEISSY